MHTARLLIQPIFRASLASIKFSPYLHLFHTNRRGNGALQTWLHALKLKVHRALPNSYWNLIARKYHHFPNGIFRNSGGHFAVNTIVGLSVIVGSTRVWARIAHCTDGFEFLGDDHDISMSDYSDSDEDHRALMMALRKLLIPVFFLVTVLVNWGQPIVIAAKVTLILFATKPSPFSVYLLIEQLRHQAIRQHPIIYKYMLVGFAPCIVAGSFTNVEKQFFGQIIFMAFFCLGSPAIAHQGMRLPSRSYLVVANKSDYQGTVLLSNNN